MKASVVIPNRNDTVMLGITVRTVLENLRGLSGEVIVADNSDADVWEILNTHFDRAGRIISPLVLGHRKDGLLKTVRIENPGMYSARQIGIEKAKGKYVLNSDSHCIWGANVVGDCIRFMEEHPEAGVCCGPIGWINNRLSMTHIRKNENGGIFGPWGNSKTLPIKIPWGFGFRIVEKEWFETIRGYSFFAKDNVSWGGGEFYLAVKSWLLGRPCWTINCNPVFHIGPHSREVESLGYRFRVYGSSGNGRQGLGILAAFYALGGQEAKKEARKSEKGLKNQYGIDIERDWPKARELAFEDHQWILENQVMSFREFIEKEPWTR